MKDGKKFLQNEEKAVRRLVVAAALALLFFLLPLCVLTVCSRRGEPGGEEKSTVEFGQRTPGYDESTEIEVLLGEETVRMSLFDYLVGVVAAEMPASYPEEALKAQAVAARTNLVYKKKIREERPASASHKDADICGNYAHCQAYANGERQREKWGDRYEEYLSAVKSAVRATDGEIVTSGGKPISAVFHSISSGKTENASDVWGSEIPYLHAVESPWDREAGKYRTEVSLTEDEFKDVFLAKFPEAILPELPEGWISAVTRSASGGIIEMTVGGVSLSGRAFRNLFGLRSANVEFAFDGGEITMITLGYGHGVGMSQAGARGMAAEGKTAEEILAWYYTGTETERLSASGEAG